MRANVRTLRSLRSPCRDGGGRTDTSLFWRGSFELMPLQCEPRPVAFFGRANVWRPVIRGERRPAISVPQCNRCKYWPDVNAAIWPDSERHSKLPRASIPHLCNAMHCRPHFVLDTRTIIAFCVLVMIMSILHPVPSRPPDWCMWQQFASAYRCADCFELE